MNTFEQPKQASENRIEQEQGYIQGALELIHQTDLFDERYLQDLQFVIFPIRGAKQTKMLFKSGVLQETQDEYANEDFIRGKRTDFVGLHPRKDFIISDLERLVDQKFVLCVLINPENVSSSPLTYEEAVVHEIAHNLFDREYVRRMGPYLDNNGVTAVNDEYRDIIVTKVSALLQKQYPKLDPQQFAFNRQEIAEIFAMLYQREFCRKTDTNARLHEEVFSRATDFLSDPDGSMAKFNEKYKRKCTMDQFYAETHMLSMLAAPLIEKEYPDFNDRIRFFWT